MQTWPYTLVSVSLLESSPSSELSFSTCEVSSRIRSPCFARSLTHLPSLLISKGIAASYALFNEALGGVMRSKVSCKQLRRWWRSRSKRAELPTHSLFPASSSSLLVGFDTTPIGRIVSRLSKDVTTLDNQVSILSPAKRSAVSFVSTDVPSFSFLSRSSAPYAVESAYHHGLLSTRNYRARYLHLPTSRHHLRASSSQFPPSSSDTRYTKLNIPSLSSDVHPLLRFRQLLPSVISGGTFPFLLPPRARP